LYKLQKLDKNRKIPAIKSYESSIVITIFDFTRSLSVVVFLHLPRPRN